MKPTRIPLFPLDVVLLPGMALPLHIFEPRYKLMIGRCMNEIIEFGVILAAEKGVARVGCTAEIAQKLKDFPDGRMDIMTEGRSVFQLVQLLEEKEYYEAMVEYPADDAVPLDAPRETRLTQLFQQAHLLLAGQEWAVANTDTDISLAYRMAARLPLETAEKQGLLEMRAEDARQEFLVQWLTAFLPQLERRVRMRRRAGGNGHGLN
ncbi:MAG TPA: LON peptidase substrate-binding domain-containing protein [Candidatus Limnocylindria bacterium]|nr:LON peptidase substrate-binding domain-containing protein [Candidatus Limnocylindria bacterium]